MASKTEVTSSPLHTIKTISPPSYNVLKPRPKDSVPIVRKKSLTSSSSSSKSKTQTTSHSAPTRIQPLFHAPPPPTHRPSPSPLDPPTFELGGSPSPSFLTVPKGKKGSKLSQSAPVRVSVPMSSSFRDEDFSDAETFEKVDSPMASSPTIFSILQKDSTTPTALPQAKSSREYSRGLRPELSSSLAKYSRGLRPEKQTYSDSSSSTSSATSTQTTSEDLQFKMESDLDPIKEDQLDDAMEFYRLE